MGVLARERRPKSHRPHSAHLFRGPKEIAFFVHVAVAKFNEKITRPVQQMIGATRQAVVS